ncbi:YeiH family protein [Thalassovita sp.]|uniref:YeiH family protein n=1 Tax=Thalassovita sp. TaxID=1979401 RepID=UPI0029DE5360|nr:YeiH family protein [Thalassovita sp.]
MSHLSTKPSAYQNPVSVGIFGKWSSAVTSVLPGLALAIALAATAFVLRGVPGAGAFSPLIIALLLGMGLGNILGVPSRMMAGLTFSMRQVLRGGIILLGLQLTLGKVAMIGGLGVILLVIILAATFLFTVWMGRVLRVEPGLTQLIAAGTSICGASAVVATNTVVRASDEDVAYAVACVTIFGTLSMLLMPVAAGFLGMNPPAFGLWVGSTIHEVAQVAGAAFAHGPEAGEVGTVSKLVRVMMLAPVVLGLGAWISQRAKARGCTSPHAKTPVPWFVFGFVALVALASTGVVPEATTRTAGVVTQFMLAVALAAMGAQTRLACLAAKGPRPAMLGALAWVFISLLGLVLVLMTV